jgi:dihydrodipicolinate synthase/N-acetylneuraminate lyase
MKQVSLRGIIPPVVTIFNHDGSFDWEGNRRLIDFLVDAGVNALFFLGSVAEFSQMSPDERREYAEFAIDYVHGRVPVGIGTGNCSTAEAISLSRHAQAAGADFVALVSPYYWQLNDEELYRYYAQVAEAADLPMLIYHIPMATGQNLKPEVIARLAADYPNIVGIKDTIDSVTHLERTIMLAKAANPAFSVLTGLDNHLFNTLAMGGDGGITGCANFARQLLLSICQEFNDGHVGRSLELFKQLQQLGQIYSLGESYSSILKEACRQVLGVNNFVRPPLTICSPDSAGKLETIRTMSLPGTD